MNTPVIEVKGLSKKYIISHEQKAQYGSLRDSITGFVKKPFEKNGQRFSSSETKEDFWALKDVSFTVNKGEIFGVVGRNGSGKSTLLKTLSRIITPTSGLATINGRTASLLEVGTGFHPELTGRENVFFNGSMLGMSRDEIGKKFDEIVKFAEIEKFLDTPVKFYSSGMYVRLAFSVAAHLEPDVLILDEVLAVGDASFQKKSMQKILSTMEKGTTVLFVSHSMESVRRLCSRGILLKNGEVAFSGKVEGLINSYNEMIANDPTEVAFSHEWKNDGSVKNDYFIPSKIYITNESGVKIKSIVENNKDHYFVVEAKVDKEDDLLDIGYAIHNENKTLMYLSFVTDVAENKWQKIKKGKVVLKAKIPAHTLNAGAYKISIAGGIHNKFWLFNPDDNNPSVQFIIEGGLSESPRWKNQRSGILAPVINWEVQQK